MKEEELVRYQLEQHQRNQEIDKVTQHLSIPERAGFIAGVEWADQHPRKGLWEAEKVCKVLKDYMFKERFFDNRITRTAIIDNVVCNLIKAMEE